MAREIKNLEEKEIKEIKEISEEKNNLTVNLGKIKTDIILVEARLSDLNKLEEDLVAKFKGNETKGRKMMDKMNKKYGNGTIDIDKGLFTPTPKIDTGKEIMGESGKS